MRFPRWYADNYTSTFAIRQPSRTSVYLRLTLCFRRHFAALTGQFICVSGEEYSDIRHTCMRKCGRLSMADPHAIHTTRAMRTKGPPLLIGRGDPLFIIILYIWPCISPRHPQPPHCALRLPATDRSAQPPWQTTHRTRRWWSPSRHTHSLPPAAPRCRPYLRQPPRPKW